MRLLSAGGLIEAGLSVDSECQLTVRTKRVAYGPLTQVDAVFRSTAAHSLQTLEEVRLGKLPKYDLHLFLLRQHPTMLLTLIRIATTSQTVIIPVAATSHNIIGTYSCCGNLTQYHWHLFLLRQPHTISLALIPVAATSHNIIGTYSCCGNLTQYHWHLFLLRQPHTISLAVLTGVS